MPLQTSQKRQVFLVSMQQVYNQAFLAAAYWAARYVLLKSLAIVIGPTPPGTGVNQPATSFASS
jgi:hypothetical protein